MAGKATPGYITGDHRDTGILAMYGRGVSPGARGQATIYDIAPTVLHLLGLPLSREFEGQVTDSLLDESFLDDYSIHSVDAYPPLPLRPRLHVLKEARRAEEIKSLQALGYLSGDPKSAPGSKRLEARWLPPEEWGWVIQGQIKFLLDRKQFERARTMFEQEKQGLTQNLLNLINMNFDKAKGSREPHK
jgi:hypothetical protein